MPGIVFGGRRWNLSSDDLPIPALIETSFRSVWLITLSISFFELPLMSDYRSRLKEIHLFIYLVGLQLFQVIILVVNAVIIYLGMQGTILQEEPRKGVSIFLYIRAALFLPEIGWHLAGAMWSNLIKVNISCSAPQAVLDLVHTTIYMGIILTIFVLFAIYLVFDPTGAVKHFPSNGNVDTEFGRLFVNPTEKGRKNQHRTWLRRIQLLFCCVSFDTGSRDAYRDVSELFSGWFNDIDVVASDLLCAVILLRRKQTQLKKTSGQSSDAQREPLIPFNTNSLVVTFQPQLGFHPPVDWMCPKNAFHFMRFAWGSYGWPAFMLTHLCTGLCIIWEGLRCFSCLRSPLGLQMRGDNCCECHTATVRTLAKVPKQDLLMVSFKDSLYKIPFFVCYDHSTCSVVIVIRGTLSVNDVLTDFTGDSTKIDLPGLPSDSLCHKGILKCSNYILNQLSEHGVLEKAFKACPSYRLVLTGHSLGAGVAATLGIQLRNKYPTLQCYAFSPPGGTFSRDLCRYTESFVLSVVVGDDAVPRLGLAQLDELKKQLLICLMETDRPKHEIISGGLNSFFCQSRSRRHSPRMSGSPSAKYKAMKKQKMEKIMKKLDDISKESKKALVRTTSNSGSTLASVVDAGVGSLTEHKLYPPGKILYLTEANDGFEIWWATPEYFDHVIISPHMITDHLPDVAYKALKLVSERTSEHL